MTQSGDVSPSPVPLTGSLLVTETLQRDDELVVRWRALGEVALDDGSLYASVTGTSLWFAPPFAVSTDGDGGTMTISPNLAIQQSLYPLIAGKRAFSVGKFVWVV